MKYVKSAEDLPADFGKINGEDHPDDVIARTNWNMAIEAAAKLVEDYGPYNEDKVAKIRALSRKR